MGHTKNYILCILWVLVLLAHNIESHGWLFSRQKADSREKPSSNPETFNKAVAEFSMEPFTSNKGKELVEKAKEKAALSNTSTCWQNAYQNLFAVCSEILAGEEQKSRFAWHLSDCFEKDIGRPPFPFCDVKSRMVDCLKRLDQEGRGVYLKFFVEANTICHRLQSGAFNRQTERLVNELKISAETAEEKLGNIGEQAERLLHSSNHIHKSLTSIDDQTQQLAQTSKDVKERVNDVLEHSQLVYQQSLEIADNQLDLRNRQINMNERLDEGMTMFNESTSKLGEEMNNLRNEAVKIEKEIDKLGDEMFMKMDTLQTKANDIENIAEVSLDKQKQLVEHQMAALEALQTVNSFQSQAMEESRETMQRLVELRLSQQNEFIQMQEQLKQNNHKLLENSKAVLAAQENFESKQATMFLAINNLFNLHNAILLESRVIKAFMIYSVFIYILYMFTNTKQTYNVRCRLYTGLCVTFFIEILVLRYEFDVEKQAWIIDIVRLIFAVLASCQLVYAIYIYRDYETLNHVMLQSLMEKVNGIIGKRQLLCEDDDTDVNWSSWVDTDISEDELEDLNKDPDFILPKEVKENLITTSVSRGYNLRRKGR